MKSKGVKIFESYSFEKLFLSIQVAIDEKIRPSYVVSIFQAFRKIPNVLNSILMAYDPKWPLL